MLFLKQISHLKLIVCLLISLFTGVGLAAQTNTVYLDQPAGFLVKALAAGTRNTGFWDQSGTPVTFIQQQKIQAWSRAVNKDTTAGNYADQLYQFVPIAYDWYHIVAKNGGYLDAGNGQEGTEVFLSAANSSKSQRFRVVYEVVQNKGAYKFISFSGKALAFTPGYANRTKLTLADPVDTGAAWQLIDPVSKARHTAHLGSSEQLVYSLAAGQEFVYGKTGLYQDGSVRYTMIIVRKPNLTKEIYSMPWTPYAERPLQERLKVKTSNPASWQKYDYSLIFNGKVIATGDEIADLTFYNPDVDSWVSRDGSFVNVGVSTGKDYLSYIANRAARRYWTTPQSPVPDFRSGHHSYTQHYAENSYRLVIDGSVVIANWPMLRNLTYSDDGEHYMFSGSPDDRYNNQNIYLDNKVLAGPYKTILRMGFFPGSHIPYYIATKLSNQPVVTFGDRTLELSADEKIHRIASNGTKIVFTTTKKDPSLTGNAALKGIDTRVRVYQYDFNDRQLKKFEGYFHDIRVSETLGQFLYQTINQQGNYVLFDETGRVLIESPLTNLKSQFLHNQPQVFYSAVLDLSGGTVSRSVSAGFPVLAAAVGNTTFLKPNQSQTRIFSIADTASEGPYQILKNGSPLNNQLWASYGIYSVAYNPSGSSMALLVNQNSSESFRKRYYTINRCLDLDWQLLLNGEVQRGKFGEPVWSELNKCFLVLKQVGNQIRLVRIAD